MKDKLTKARRRINKIDRQMAKLFEERMSVSASIAKHKKEHGIAILDKARESEVIKKNSEMIKNDEFRDFYLDFQKKTMEISKDYQYALICDESIDVKMLHVKGGYPIVVGHGLIEKANEYFDLSRKVLIVTDDGVPNNYAENIANLCANPTVITVKKGEESKSITVLEELLLAMQKNGFGREDCVVAVGGGMVGDLAGFAASVYMRGIDFYNIPTTLLSQVDSSIGGKTAVNLGGVKNAVGNFKRPKCVLVDTDTLKTLEKRHFASGLAEVIKMSLTSDAELFGKLERFSKEEIRENIEDLIIRSLLIKKKVVEEDEKETGIRRILNFGHTLGHAIESAEGMSAFTHGECVALGMLPLCSNAVRVRLKAVLEKVGLPTEYPGDLEKAIEYIRHDKKCFNDCVLTIAVEVPGKYTINEMPLESFKKMILEL